MQTVEQPPAGPSATPPGHRGPRPPGTGEPQADDLQLLLNWAPDADETARLRTAAIGTTLVHLLLIGGLAVMPQQRSSPLRFPDRMPKQITKLIDPPSTLTQKAPNKSKISKEIAVQSPAPSIPVPSPGPGAQARKFTPPKPQNPRQPAAAHR